MRLFTFLVITFVLFTNNLMAEESFGDLYSVFESWAQGNLGKLIALIGFLIVFITYTFSILTGGMLSYSYLMKGSFIALIAGGLVGIANTFFNMGQSTFAIIP